MKLVLAVTAVLAMALSVSALSRSATPVAQAAPVAINLIAVGAQENPPVSGSGTAQGYFTFDKATKQLTYFVQVRGITSDQVTSSHIHRGAAGVNGPIVYPLSLVAFQQVSGSITLTDADIADLEAGRFYFNVHSVTNPGGFARAQMILPGSATVAAPAPAAVSPPNTGDAGLADAASSSLLEVAGLVLAAGAGTLALARRRA